mgnify:CR=1 FL=1
MNLLPNKWNLFLFRKSFASITEKLQEAFIPIAEALLPIVDGFASLVSHATLLKTVITAIAGIMGGKMLASLALNAASMGLFGKKAKEAATASVVGAAAESGKRRCTNPRCWLGFIYRCYVSYGCCWLCFI